MYRKRSADVKYVCKTYTAKRVSAELPLQLQRNEKERESVRGRVTSADLCYRIRRIVFPQKFRTSVYLARLTERSHVERGTSDRSYGSSTTRSSNTSLERFYVGVPRLRPRALDLRASSRTKGYGSNGAQAREDAPSEKEEEKDREREGERERESEREREGDGDGEYMSVGERGREKRGGLARISARDEVNRASSDLKRL